MNERLPRPRAYTVIGLLAALDLVASAVVLLSTRDFGGIEGILIVVVLGITTLIAAALALWIAARAPAREDLLALAVGLLGFSLAVNLLLGRLQATLQAPLDALLITAASAGTIFGTLGLLRFFSLFPRPIIAEDLALLHADSLSRLSPRRRERRERALAGEMRTIQRLQGDGLFRTAGSVTLLLGVVTFAALAVPPAARDPVFFGVVALPWIPAIAWGAPGSVYLSNLAFAGSTGANLRRLMWVRWGLTAAVLAVILFGALLGVGIIVGFDSAPVIVALVTTLPLPPLCFLFGLMIAVFYEGAVDPSLAIRRTTVYGALGILFVFFFAGLGNVVSEFIEARLGLPGIVGTGLYGGFVAVLLLPLRSRFIRVAARWVLKLQGDEPAKSA